MRLTITILLALTTTSHLIEAATIRQGSIDRGSLGNSWRLNEHKVDRLNRPRLDDESLVIRDEYSLLQKVLPTSNANATNEYADGRIYNRQRRVDDERQEEYNTLEQSIEPPSTPNKSKWIAHGTISILCFGLLIPTSISSALFRHLFPTYWIYIHVIINVATLILVSITVCVAFVTMHSLGDANEGHLKELHHIVGLGLLLLTSFQTANGFLRPPREFRTEDREDNISSISPDAIHSIDWDRDDNNLTPRKLWHLVHRITGIVLFVLGTWQIQSGLGLYAEKYNGVDWGPVYLGYVGWLVVVLGGVKLWMIYKKREVVDGDENSEEENLS